MKASAAGISTKLVRLVGLGTGRRARIKHRLASAPPSSLAKAVLDPGEDLQAGATYEVALKGGAGGAKDVAGNPLGSDKTWSLTMAVPPPGATPPETTIDSGPSEPTNNASASFAFSSSEPNSTFECSLDHATYSDCTSPQSYAGLADDPHTFEVRVKDEAANADLTPARRN